MMLAVAKALMSLATCCLGESRRDWAFAMQGEFDAAIEEGCPLTFAAGCLIAAWREMPRQAEGRLVLANYALALGLLLPMAVLQFTHAIGVILLFIGQVGPGGLLSSGGTQNPYLVWSQLSAAPILLMLWLLLGVGHLRLAWVLVDRDWSSVVKVGALIGAATVTLFTFMGVLFLDVGSLISHAAALAFEFAAIIAAARGQARLVLAASPDLLAW